jgi:hypothetical protein
MRVYVLTKIKWNKSNSYKTGLKNTRLALFLKQMQILKVVHAFERVLPLTQQNVFKIPSWIGQQLCFQKFSLQNKIWLVTFYRMSCNAICKFSVKICKEPNVHYALRKLNYRQPLLLKYEVTQSLQKQKKTQQRIKKLASLYNSYVTHELRVAENFSFSFTWWA